MLTLIPTHMQTSRFRSERAAMLDVPRTVRQLWIHMGYRVEVRGD